MTYRQIISLLLFFCVSITIAQLRLRQAPDLHKNHSAREKGAIVLAASQEKRVHVTTQSLLQTNTTNPQFTTELGWQWQNPIPGAVALLDVDFANTNLGIIVGDLGSIFRTTDGGTSWTDQSLSTDPWLNSIAFVDATTAIAVGYNGTIVRTADAGITWTNVPSGTSLQLYDVCFASPQIGYAVGNGGIILKTTNAGNSWTGQSSGVNTDLRGISFVDQYQGIAVGGGGMILRTTNGGQSWTVQISPTSVWLWRLSLLTLSDGIIVGEQGVILKTTDSGITWFIKPSNTTDYLYRVTFSGPNIGYAIGGLYTNTTILKTTNRGETWTSQPSPAYGYLYGISFPSSTLGIVVGLDGWVIKTTNEGNTWLTNSVSITSNLSLRGVFFNDANTGTAVGENGIIVKTVNGGQTWSVQTLGFQLNYLMAIHFADLSTGIAVGRDGAIIRTTNGGSQWVQQNSGTTRGLNDIFLTGPMSAIAVGDFGTILRTTNGGTTWNSQISGSNMHYVSICFTNSSDGIAVGGFYPDTSAFLRTTDGGATWTEQRLSGTPLIGVSFADANNGIVVGQAGTILRTTNGGTTWFQLTSGISGDLDDVSYTSPNIATVVGSYPNTVALRTTNGGNTWMRQNSRTRYGLCSISFANDNTGTAIGGLGTILRTESGGVTASLTVNAPNGSESWQVGTIHNITWSSTNVTSIRIELSTNNGATWPIVVANNTPASTGTYAWTVPSFPSTQCRVRISDVSNPSIFDISDAPFTIVGLPSTIVITHGMQLELAFANAKWKNLKWLFCMADAVSPTRQICLIRNGSVYQTQLQFSGFASLSDDALMDDIIAQYFTNNLSLDASKDVVFVFDWVEESDRNMRGYSEAAGDALTGTLIQTVPQFPWLLNHLHFIGHSRGTVVNSESIQRLIFYAANGLLPPGVALDQNIHMTTLDAHPAGHWIGTYEAMNDDAVNSSNIGIGVVGWRSGLYKSAYIDNFYQEDDIFNGLSWYHGVRPSASTSLNGVFPPSQAHQFVHTWYHGTVNLLVVDDGFGVGARLQVNRHWYSDGLGAIQGFHFSRGRTNDLSPIASVGAELKEVSDDATHGVDRLVFNGDFSFFSDVLGLPGWEKQGGGGFGHVDKYDGWNLNPHLELDQLNESRRHNLVYIPTNASFLNFRSCVKDRSNDDVLNVYIGNSLVFVKPLLQTTNYQWETAVVPPSLRGTSTTINFQLDGQGLTDSEVWIDDVSFSRVPRMVVTVASPVFLHAYDAFGNHTGPTSDTTWVAEIPGSQYIFESDTLPHPRKNIILPPPSTGTNYRFVIRSRNATGHFNFQIEDYTSGQQTLNVVFDSVAIQPHTVAMCTLAKVSPMLPLSVDLDGNGTPDTTISATKYFQDFHVVATAGLHGSISPRDTVIRNYGDSVTFVIVPDSAYRISEVLVDSVSIGIVSAFTFRNIQRNHTIHATFDLITSTQSTADVPVTFNLYQNYPNPFNPATVLKYDLPISSHVSLKVFNIVGQIVATLVDETKPAGKHEITWNPEGFASGVYLYHIEAGSFIQTKKFLLLR